MVVRIRFRRGPRVERKKGKNFRVAWLLASLLTLGSVSCLILGLWRLGVDFGWAAAFVFTDSILSHWQVWLTSALLLQLASWKLNRIGKPEPESPSTDKRDEKQMTASA